MKTRMKILAVSHEFPPIGVGGANACYFLTKGFVEKGHEVALVTANFKNLPEQEVQNGVRIYRVNAARAHQEHCSFKEMLSYLCKAMPLADKLQKQEHFDICLVFFGIPSGPIGYVLKKKYKLPYVIRFGGGDVPGFQERFTKVYKLIAPAIKMIWRNADARIANSEGLRQMALNFYDKKEFQVICNGVDTDMFYPAWQKEHSDFQILFVSRLIERKGLQHIIPQLKHIQSQVAKKITLVIVGDGPYRSELERLTAECGAWDMVRFEGQKGKQELLPYYQSADLFILPSAKEGMPNVVLEAMACGLPILMTPCEGSAELVDGNGYIQNKEEFASEIVELIVDEQLREKMGKASIALVDKKFTWDKTVEAYLKLMIGIEN
jgi:glycosyltransferase involved in cell wall biosynthesis